MDFCLLGESTRESGRRPIQPENDRGAYQCSPSYDKFPREIEREDFAVTTWYEEPLNEDDATEAADSLYDVHALVVSCTVV